ncbi:hypothetical protein EUGRSUZ_L01474 [Eucalyptus grandis]|uniref:TF-B3 domain-containing protein n=3 Tax=Eucalyptus grandis TaxID=71139 RepID=A0AAD9TAU1_EUCGR|nr:hypothetical protein EUGRSUZ_L01474 [Eucalyptus grandis]
MAAPALASSPPLATHSFGSQARGRNQLLPRYWPRITDQELQQISGEYPFDAKGSEWIVQFGFRFRPNNNSRMYVLDGVTPCIQSMQLQAGDTVTFSRLEPEGKLVMGFKKASTDQAKPSQAPGKKGRDGEEPREEEDASISEQRPEQQLEESFEQSDAHFQGNMGRAEPRLRPEKRSRDCNRGEAVSGTSHARRNKRIRDGL